MEIPNYFRQKKELQNLILTYLNNAESDNFDFQKIEEFFDNHEILENHDELEYFLQLIFNIFNNHHRHPDFVDKITKILLQYKEKINQTLSNAEILNIFIKNKLLLLQLIEQKLIIVDEYVINVIIQYENLQYFHYFLPEIKEIIGDEKVKSIEKMFSEDYSNIYENFEEKRHLGENDSYIGSLIRQDLVEEFISYVNRMNYPLNSKIIPSIFETNSYLIENQPSLIEYATFFGSIQIVRYLLYNGVQFSNSLWIYAVHSNNAEIIHYLEENDENKDETSFLQCLLESIKCHHDDIANYIQNNLLNENDMNNQDIDYYCFKYSNYSYFTKYATRYNFAFPQYHYSTVVNFIINKHKDKIENKIINPKYFNQID